MRARHLRNSLEDTLPTARTAQTRRSGPAPRFRTSLPPEPLQLEDPRHAQMTDMARAVDRWLTGASLGLVAVIFVVQLLRWVFS